MNDPTTTYCTFGSVDVLKERLRQINAEGWTPEHDDEHDTGAMAQAAMNYIGAHIFRINGLQPRMPSGFEGVLYGMFSWPWSREWWKPTTPRRDLVKAAALILAEIDRLDRAELRRLS